MARTALITGGARRVGRAIVERLSREGFNVVFTYQHSSAQAAELARSLDNPSLRCLAIQVDLAALANSGQPLRAAVDSLGGLDVLVNNASVYLPDAALAAPDAFERMFRINVTAPIDLVEWFAPSLRARRGHVVNMLDLLAERPWPRYSKYCSTKASLWNHTLSLARSLAPEVTVNGIAPGVVAWPDDFPQSERDKYLQRVPLARAGTPDDVASLVHFLATEGTYITGQSIRLDGGRSIT
jgi:pteridine reductase